MEIYNNIFEAILIMIVYLCFGYYFLSLAFRSPLTIKQLFNVRQNFLLVIKKIFFAFVGNALVFMSFTVLMIMLGVIVPSEYCIIVNNRGEIL